MTRTAKKAHEAVTLLASAIQTATGAGDSSRLPVMQAAAFVLDVTAAATASGDTLDVYVQTMLDGTNWVDVVHFTQILGDITPPVRYIAKVTSHVATAEFENGTALGAAAVRNLLGDEWRVRWAITDADTDDASFTFSVAACPM